MRTPNRSTVFLVAVAAATSALIAAPAAVLAAHRFSDVPDDSIYAGAVERLNASGVVKGCTTTTFCPQDDVTRGQLALLLDRLSGSSDVAPSVNAATVMGMTPSQLRGQTGAQGPAGPAGSNGISSAYFAQKGPSAQGASSVVELTLPAGSAYVINGKGAATGLAGSETLLFCQIYLPGGSELDSSESSTPLRRASVALQATLVESVTPTTVALGCLDFNDGEVTDLKITAVAVDELDDQSPVA